MMEQPELGTAVAQWFELTGTFLVVPWYLYVYQGSLVAWGQGRACSLSRFDELLPHATSSRLSVVEFFNDRLGGGNSSRVMTLIDVFRIRSEYLVDLPLDLREKAISLIVAQELDASKNTSADFLVD